jgi:hypothetical protein
MKSAVASGLPTVQRFLTGTQDDPGDAALPRDWADGVCCACRECGDHDGVRWVESGRA